MVTRDRECNREAVVEPTMSDRCSSLVCDGRHLHRTAELYVAIDEDRTTSALNEPHWRERGPLVQKISMVPFLSCDGRLDKQLNNLPK